MYPYLLKNERLPLYSIMTVVGILSAVFLFKFLTKKKELSDYGNRIFGVILVLSLGFGFLGARLFQMLYNFIKTGSIGQGITFMGGLVFGVITFFVGYAVVYRFASYDKKEILKSDLKKTVNIAPVCIALGHAFGRVGCFFAGCCYGKRTNAWFGIDFVSGITKEGEWIYFGFKRIPTQLFEAIFLFLLCFFCLILLLRTKGFLPLITYAYGYSIFRFILEFLRDDSARAVVGVLSPSQWQSIFIFVCITVFVILLRLNEKRQKLEKKIKKI